MLTLFGILAATSFSSPPFTANSLLISQASQCNLTVEKYQKLRVAVQDNNVFDDKPPQVTVQDFSSILSCQGTLISVSNNVQVYRWQDTNKPSRLVQGTFKNGKMVIWKGQGF